MLVKKLIHASAEKAKTKQKQKQRKTEPWTAFSFSVVGVVFLFGIVVPLIDSDGIRSSLYISWEDMISKTSDVFKITGEFTHSRFSRQPSTGRLFITTNPGEAEVYIGGEKKGETPVMIEDLRPGNYVFTIKKAGYIDFTSAKYVYASITPSAVDVRLTPIPASTGPEPPRFLGNRTAPTVLMEPKEILPKKSTRVTATVEDDIQVKECSLLIDGQVQSKRVSLLPTCRKCTAAVDWKFESAGEYWIGFRCKDNSGLIGETSIKFKVIDNLPKVADITPVETIISKPTRFSSVVEDDVKVQECSLVIDGQVQNTKVSLGRSNCKKCIAYVVPWTFASAGEYSVGLRCKDSSGQIGEKTTKVKVSEISPTLTSISPSTTIYNKPTKFIATVEDDVEVKSCTFSVDDTGILDVKNPTSLSKSPCKKCDVSQIYTFDSIGEKKVKFSCVDNKGNWGDVETSITVTNKAPVVSIASINEGESFLPRTITAKVQDDVVVKSCILNVKNTYSSPTANPTLYLDVYMYKNYCDKCVVSKEITFDSNGEYLVWFDCWDGLANGQGQKLKVTVSGLPLVEPEIGEPQ